MKSILKSLKLMEKNYLFLYIETFFATLPGIAGAFAGAYAVRLGATNTQIGIMSSLPSLLVVFVSIPFGRLLQTSSKKMLLSLGGIALYRLGYMAFALAPLINLGFLTPGLVFVFIFTIIAIPIQFFNIGNVGMVIDIVPEDHRAKVFTMRNIISALVSIGGVFLAGQWLSKIPFPGNYQLMFITVGLFSQISLVCWLSMKFPPKTSENNNNPDLIARKSISLQIKSLIDIFHESPMFTRFVINTLLFNIGSWMVGPLYVLYTVRQLEASDAWIGTAGTIASICSLLGWLVGRRLVEWWGELVTHRRIILLLGLYPVMVGLFPNLNMILIFGGIFNLFAPGFSLSNNNLWMKLLPGDRREDATAIFNTLMSIGPFIFPLVGVTLAGYFGISITMIVCGVMALLGSLSFWVKKINLDGIN